MRDRDTFRTVATFVSAALGIVIVFVIFNITRGHAANKDEATLVIGIAGTAISMIGTLVGFVAGQAVGATGKEKAEERAGEATQRADRAERRASVVSGLSEPGVLRQARAEFPDLFQ
jgi:hypothetical protein